MQYLNPLRPHTHTHTHPHLPTPIHTHPHTLQVLLQGSCFYRLNTNGSTFDYWTKIASSAFKNGNCYCYALNYFKGVL